ncbi:MAG: hypothetical protein ACO3EE_12060 [Flavobacteriales bacterium]
MRYMFICFALLASSLAHAEITGFKDIKFDTTTIEDVVAMGGECHPFEDKSVLYIYFGTRCSMGSTTVLDVPVDGYTIEFNGDGKITRIKFDSKGSRLRDAAYQTFTGWKTFSDEKRSNGFMRSETLKSETLNFKNGNRIFLIRSFSTGIIYGVPIITELVGMTFYSKYQSTSREYEKSTDY